MKTKMTRRFLSALLALVILLGMIPATAPQVFAGHTCEECGEWIDGSPYCSECYKCAECISLCIQCGICTDCSGNEICEGCSDEESEFYICTECGIDKGSHCPDCDTCYLVSLSWCVECGACEDCTPMCDGCSLGLGKGLLCVNCAAEDEGHCPDCGGCYFEIHNWCQECKLCQECVEICNYCTSEVGDVICVECAIGEGLHCPDCNECYGDYGGDQCEECQICAGCRDICSTHDLCIDCAIEQDYHCPGCEACGEDATICEGCGERCSECADDMCEDCNLCSDCVQLCPGCGACSNCADICENCQEYCSDCEGICDDCNLCLVCCEDYANFEGCDCSDWVCIQHDSWAAHFQEAHTEKEGEHYPRAVSGWSWDMTQHWQECVYCDSSDHHLSVGSHTYDQYSQCTVCGYIKDSKIMIVEQPKDARNVFVTSPDEAYDASNIARMRVKAFGLSELTYTWCMKYYKNGQYTYKPLAEMAEPQEGECFDSPELRYVVPTDACCNEYIIVCIITDAEGNQVRTQEAKIVARHNFQYYMLYKTHEWSYSHVAVNNQAHKLQCVGECCDDKQSGFLPHEDKNGDKLCDICDYKITGILITKQPSDSKSAYVSSAWETYDETNIAHFSVEATGESALTYTWCCKQYVNGKITYVPLTGAGPLENYDGPNLDILAPEDACCNEYTFACIITDADGNEVRTNDVTLKAKHNYQHFKDYLTDKETPYPGLLALPTGHFVQCVGTGCTKKVKFLRHEDANKDFTCDICSYRSKIDLVELTVTAPREGAKPNYGVSAESLGYYSTGGMNNGRYWFVSDNGVDNWKLIDNTHTFTAGKYYKFEIELATNTGYEFDRHYDYNSRVLVKVNGGPGFFASKTYNKDLAHYITAVCMFGECNDSIVENIVIDSVVTPVAGEKPTYEAATLGSGYRINANKNVYYDDWMNDRKLYYIKNGIGWFDMTAWAWVYENEIFIPGHEYEVRVYLETEEGYEFAHTKYYEPTVVASINGFGAEAVTTGSDCVRYQQAECTFQCGQREIQTVMINGISQPQAGKTPDYNLNPAYPELYRLDPNYGGTGGVIWYDSQGNQLLPTDTFVEGEKYRVEIKVISTQYEGADICKFAKDTAAYVNHEQVIPNDTWDNVYASNKAVYIYYTFTKGALAPDTIPGDIDNNKQVNTDDVVALLLHISVPDMFPLGSGVVADFNKDAVVNTDDAVTLLLHISMPDMFPLVG